MIRSREGRAAVTPRLRSSRPVRQEPDMPDLETLTCPNCEQRGGLNESLCTLCGARGYVERSASSAVAEGAQVPVSVARFVVTAMPSHAGEGWCTIIREGGLGDILFTVPLVVALKEQGLRVAYRCAYDRYALVSHVADEWELMSMPMKEGRVIDLRGVADDGAPMSDMNRVEAYLRFAGVEASDLHYWMRPSAQHKIVADTVRGHFTNRSLAVIAPEASTGERSLLHPEEIAEALQDDGWEVAVIAPDRHPLQPAGSGGFRKTTLTDLVGCILAADVFIGPDSGPLHIASALGVPCVGVFRTIDPLLRMKHQQGWVAFAPGVFDVEAIVRAATMVCHGAELREVIREVEVVQAPTRGGRKEGTASLRRTSA